MGAAEKAYRAVVTRIARGAYDHSAHITEAEICRVAGVSRTPVREALRRLQSEGVVTIKPNCGAVVRNPDPREMNDIIELRAALESYAAERAAERVSAQVIVRLRELAQAQIREASGRRAGYTARIVGLHRRFHRALHAASGCTRLPVMLRPLVDMPAIMRAFAQLRREELARLVRDHGLIVQALEAGDVSEAGRITRAHILALRGVQAGGEVATPRAR